MKTLKNTLVLSLALILISGLQLANANNSRFKKQQEESSKFTIIKGKVMDDVSGLALIFATIAIEGSNIATVSNSDGQFLIKVPNDKMDSKLAITFIGYNSYSTPLKELKVNKVQSFRLTPVSVELTEVSVFPNNPSVLITKILENRDKNYSVDPMLMTAFYREIIKKRRTYVGLSEAAVQVYKQPYNSYKKDMVKVLKARKGTDVTKMDTLLFKLQGGAYSTLLLDVIKDPYLILDEEVQDMYEYSIQSITRIDGALYYIIQFEQKSWVKEPMFFGQLYVNMDNMAVSSIVFNLNTDDKEAVGKMFIKKKPMGVRIYPTRASYMVNYREQGGKYYYSYSRGEVVFKVKWKKKLLNTTYTTAVEMAITDREATAEKGFKSEDRLKISAVMSDEIKGFTDADFWGEYNVIEPEQSIESAIKKIKRNLDKLED